MNDEMRQRLVEYGQIIDQINRLKKQKDSMKDSLKGYLEDNEYITEDDPEIKFDCRDNENQMWRLTNTKQKRPKPDWDYLKQRLPDDDYKKARNENLIEVFVAKRIKAQGDENDVTMMAPPVANK
jgi:hypothetical protein